MSKANAQAQVMDVALQDLGGLVDALRDQLDAMARKLADTDPEGKRIAFEVGDIDLERKVVARTTEKVAAKGTVGWGVLAALVGAPSGELEVSAGKDWSDALTHTVRIKLKPRRPGGGPVDVARAAGRGGR